jgi:hypothetical protein
MVTLSRVIIMLPLTDLKVMYDLSLGRVDILELPTTTITNTSSLQVLMLLFNIPEATPQQQ